MIALESAKKLQTTVVYVASDPAPDSPGLLLGFDPSGLSELMEFPEPGNSPGEFIVTSMRNQLTVTFSPNTLVFGDGSSEVPVRTDFPERVARIAEYIGLRSGLSYAAVGLNFAIEAEAIDETLPSEAILGRMVNEDVFESSEYNTMGASVRFWYVSRDKWYDLRIEPRGNQYDGPAYFAHLYVQIDTEAGLPSPAWLGQALSEEYQEYLRVLAGVLAPGKEDLR